MIVAPFAPLRQVADGEVEIRVGPLYPRFAVAGLAADEVGLRPRAVQRLVHEGKRMCDVARCMVISMATGIVGLVEAVDPGDAPPEITAVAVITLGGVGVEVGAMTIYPRCRVLATHRVHRWSAVVAGAAGSDEQGRSQHNRML